MKSRLPFGRVWSSTEAYRKLQKIFTFVEMAENYEGVPNTLTLLHSERPKLYAILAFLSAIGLSDILLSGKGMRVS